MFAVRKDDTPEARDAENREALAAQAGQAPEQQGMSPGTDLERRSPYIPPQEDDPDESADVGDLFKGKAVVEATAPPEEASKRRHSILMSTLEDEYERQAEERFQAQTDDDYYHHLQWTQEDAKVVEDRGQAPLVFNEARASIDWMCGTERRLRKDYKIRPRERNDEQNAELKTKVFKYVDDVNYGPWHRSRAAKDQFVSGLGWIEESISSDPDHEMLQCGYEDWRRVMRDSRGRNFTLDDGRYLHRRKVLDLDYAMALLPNAARHLQAIAGDWPLQDEDAGDVWYLGQHLTNASTNALKYGNGIMGGDYTVRQAGTNWDRGRRNGVELIESWYRIPKTVDVFAGGPQFRKVVNKADPGHVQLLTDRHPTYQTVKMQMHVMVSTRVQPVWDGVSPFRHGKFLLVPLWGYRRGRDGMVYGQMRGMRDPQDDLNKRRSKAQHALSSNRMIVRSGMVDDIEEARAEGARADGVIIVNGVISDSIKLEKYSGDVTQNMEIAQADIEHIRNAGGVTGENLGQNTSAQSGKAIIAKQEQGSMTTYELFDNYFLAFKMAGQLRLSHIEQFCNQEWEFRIDPEHKPAEWVRVNTFDPRTGTYTNDITASQADFIVDQQDYRATLAQSATESMFELLGQLATFAPQVVLSLLDLAVDSSDVPAKAEWVSRIRKLNGQRDPSKPPTPEEEAADQANVQKQQLMEKITIETAQAKLQEILAKVNKTNADKVLASLQSLLAGVEAAVQIATVPGVAMAADGLAKSAGFVDATPADGVVVATPGNVAPLPQEAAPLALPAPSGAQPPAAQQPTM